MIFISEIKIRYNKIILIAIIFFLLIFNNVYASEFVNADISISDEFLKWQNLSEDKRGNALMPSIYSVDISKAILEEELNKIDFAEIVSGNITYSIDRPVSNSALASKYSMKNYYSIDVKSQGKTECCWAIAILNSMELNIQVTEGKEIDFSERHMDYATSEDFYDGINPNAFKRNVSIGGTPLIGLAYLTNGQGAILEEEMPFKEDMSSISLSEIDKVPSVYVTDYEHLPTIYKHYNTDGSAVCYNSEGVLYTDEEVRVIREKIKKHIVKYGGISAYTASSEFEYYSSADVVSSKSYYCNDINSKYDHAVTIVGWDDNYSKDNFTGKAKPVNDGAYLVVNSYSTDFFDEGFLYISYEDVWIESSLYGVSGTSEIDYKNIYQHDNLGAGVPLVLYNNYGLVPDTIFYSSIYSRNVNESEVLDRISLSSDDYCEFEIYVNPNGTDLTIDNLIKVATTDILTPGYHQIEFTPVNLVGNEFAVVVKQVAVDGEAGLMLEPHIDGTFYEYANSRVGDSKISVTGKKWQELGDLGTIDAGNGVIIDLTKSDVCIKAFTKEYEQEEVLISSSKYEVTIDKYITKIYDNMTISDVLNDIIIIGEYQIYTKDNEIVTDLNSLVSTNMYLNLNGEKYYFVVRADINGDGKISLIDLSKHLACYAELEGYSLDGAALKACDLNLDGRFSLIDLSQFIVLYNNM